MISKLFIRLLPIQILLSSISAVNGIVSGIYGSNFIGEDAMSAVGLYAPVNMVFVAIGMVLLAGTQVLCGKYMGKDQVKRTNDIFSVDIIAFTVLGIVFGILMFIFAEPFARLLGANEDSIVHLTPYIRGMAPGLLPLIGTQQLSAFLALEKQNKRTAAGSIIYILMNAGLGYLFVGKLGMGAFGLSVASSIGLWVFMAFLAQYYLTDKAVIRFSKDNILFSDLIDIFKSGYAGALSFAYQVLRGFGLNAIIIAHIGNAGLASLATYTVINNLLWALPAGITNVARLLLSVSYGEEDRENLVRVVKEVFYKYIPVDILLSAAVAILSVPITRIYYQDPSSEVFQMTRMALIIVPVSMALSIISVLFVSWGEISGKHNLVHILSAMDGVVTMVIFSFIMVPLMGMNAIWIAYIVNGLFTTLAIIIYAWVRLKKAPSSIADLMVIPEGFGVSKDDMMDIRIKDVDDVVATAKQVQRFCEKQGIDERRSYFAGLALEEMSGNVVEHGFSLDNKRHTIDVRVVKKNDDVILRVKDDCLPFDPKEQSEMLDSDDLTKNIGIRMVYSIAKEIKYQHMLGLNVLSVRI